MADVAAEANRAGKLSPEDKKVIGDALDKLAVVCENPTPPTAETLKQAGMDELIKVLHDRGVL